MIRRFVSVAVFAASLLLGSSQAISQDEPTLTVSEPEFSRRASPFGFEEWIAQGVVTNDGDTAAVDVNLVGEVLDEDGEAIGFAYGVLVDVCGLGVPPDRPLEPGDSSRYLLAIELDDEAFVPASLDIDVIAASASAAPVNPFLTYADITTVYEGDVARVEWTRRGELLFATGCESDLYTTWQWYTVDTETGEATATDLPYPDVYTPEILDRLALETPQEIRNARIAFHPDSRRFVFQDRINTALTAEPDGTFQRLLWDALSRYSLAGYIWLPDERYLAYYFGAFGDPVIYYTGSLAGQKISAAPPEVIPSLIVPGPTQDGGRVVIAREVDGVVGYDLASTTGGAVTRLFDGEAPGNNYPAPVYAPAPDGGVDIFIIRDIDGQARLQCYDLRAETLNSLTVLPLRLSPDESGWSAISPDGRLLALAAEGRHGGLWLIDLTQYASCTR
ncbi:MAG: hypothetical protein IPM16_17295 [Chloroflexi bacterium]|nr:hypothetical protein [Chloroflexota bacterium]